VTDVFILSAARTSSGKFGGGLSTVPATELGSTARRGGRTRLATLCLGGGGAVALAVETV